MKRLKSFLVPGTAMFLVLFLTACKKEEVLADKGNQEAETSEIARVEKAERITLFKKNFIYDDGLSHIVLTMATRSKSTFDHVIEKYEVSITPVYKNALPVSDVVSSNQEAVSCTGEEVMVEFSKMQRAEGVIGFKTNYHMKKTIPDLQEKVSLSGYTYYLRHYSNHWPKTYGVSFINQGGGLHFYARWRWYQGYGSRTVCLGNNCSQEFDLFGGATYNFNVDGPYQMRVEIGLYEGGEYSDWWTY